MDPSGTSFLKKSRFTEFLVRENGLDEPGFQEWIFYPGMLFNAMDKWWGNQGKRERPHEGLDLCLYRDREDRILRLDEKTKIPALYDGVVVRVVDDFIGKSVIVEHRLPGSDNSRFCTIYGHTNLPRGLHVDRIVKAGDILATLARPNKSQSNIPPHLHISLGWIFNEISYENLDWDTMDTLKPLKWVDPLQVISRHFL
ncbi:MAG: hypothetical protein A2V86_15095 [Deltaproteobacteria bacterium RBG_16_49_23]|nr:MAG: hypothetical protein A2V86_15095 [Deltaproteobacteria bacterium RBG_16_49_23]